MAKKQQLRQLRSGTVINKTSKAQEKDVDRALKKVVENLMKFSSIALVHKKQWKLADICEHLQKHFPKVDFHCHFDNTYMSPDGGILNMVANNGEEFVILISECKNQGTNDLRAKEGKPKQAKGNAIERLGKNVIGLRAALRSESIFPFVCFGYGCDFTDGSTIRDRVTTIAMFGELNKTYLHALGPHGIFDRGSFYFREHAWTVDEMAEILFDVAKRSVQYYFSKYGESRFLPPSK